MFKSIKFHTGQSIAFDQVLHDLVRFRYEKKKQVAVEGDFAQRGSVIDVFPANFDAPIRIDLDDDQVRSIYSFNLATGKSIWEHKMVMVVPHKKTRLSRSLPSPFTAETPLNHTVDVEAGDFVVHNNHGIGKFLGVESIGVKDHLVIEYKGGDKLYVPKHDMHLVQRYIGFSKKPPRLFKLGTKEWQKVKKQIEKRLRRMAAELLHVQAARAALEGIAFDRDNKWQREFERQFPYEETADQLKATGEVKKDMESGQPMDRLICGDVGYGKTEVAIRAIFKAVMSGKQVAVLVPTTILAEQHYYNFSARFKDFPIHVDMLSRFRTRAQQQDTIRAAAAGEVDVLIGTHRLLSKDVVFKELGLIVIDEEQRFGVAAKEKLKHLRLLADVLTLTATPIPRTLYMALAGTKDMSVISTPPHNRIAVETHITRFDEEVIMRAIQRELKRKGQVFFLHNRVEDIESVAAVVQRLVPGARVASAHGQMPGRLLEEIMLRFLKCEIDVLVCTTIIESGIDIPNANTLIINNAHHFGLSDLHQLRGRVGRMDVQAYAYFLVPPHHRMSTIAKQRIEVMEKYSDLGAGFHIAFEDMQIRGAGNLLGQEQHGYIASIGFDLYCRLLKESVDGLKKELEDGHVQLGVQET